MTSVTNIEQKNNNPLDSIFLDFVTKDTNNDYRLTAPEIPQKKVDRFDNDDGDSEGRNKVSFNEYFNKVGRKRKKEIMKKMIFYKAAEPGKNEKYKKLFMDKLPESLKPEKVFNSVFNKRMIFRRISLEMPVSLRIFDKFLADLCYAKEKTNFYAEKYYKVGKKDDIYYSSDSEQTLSQIYPFKIEVGKSNSTFIYYMHADFTKYAFKADMILHLDITKKQQRAVQIDIYTYIAVSDSTFIGSLLNFLSSFGLHNQTMDKEIMDMICAGKVTLHALEREKSAKNRKK